MNNDSLKVFNNWIACADEDLELARRELNYIDEEILIRSVCFHCQQAVEKYFKAFLILKDFKLFARFWLGLQTHFDSNLI